MGKKKQRLDAELVTRGLVENRSRAAALVLAGRVFTAEERMDKPGTPVTNELPLSVREGDRYASRGGYKLQGALDALNVPVSDLVCLDIGASTGGFTDCLLQRGARLVYAVDVGQGQLVQKLRDHPQVENRERTNARHLVAADFKHAVELVVVDASFIGMGLLLPAIGSVLSQSRGSVLAMVKPQFEVGKEAARRHRGVIKDPVLREQALEKVRGELGAAGFKILAEADSTLAGPKGNVERFVWAELAQDSQKTSTQMS